MKLVLVVLVICLANQIRGDDDNKIEDKKVKDKETVSFRYKSNATLDCSTYSDVQYFKKKLEPDSVESRIESDGKNTKIEDNKLILKDLRVDDIKAEYFCKSNGNVVKKFKILIEPYIYKPDKPSVTVSVGGKIDFKCVLLYGSENNEDIVWTWRRKNDTDLVVSEKILIVSNTTETTLTLLRADNSDKGEYECEAKNKHGVHKEVILLRVKDAFAALWPFLAIVAEVIILCLIILIYEKKCSKKNHTTEEDNEQSQNLMGKENNSELKKRATKA